jgi:putative zinc finger protein
MGVDSPVLACRDAIDLMADYLEQALGGDLLAALERHLADCRPCVAYLATYRKTRELTGEAGRIEMPEEMKTRLRQLLLDQLGRDRA